MLFSPVHNIEIEGLFPNKTAQRQVRRSIRRWFRRNNLSEIPGTARFGEYDIYVEKQEENELIFCSVNIRTNGKTMSGTALAKDVGSAMEKALDQMKRVFVVLPQKKKEYLEAHSLAG